MKTKNEEKIKCTCGTGIPCCIDEPEKACTCGKGEPCCVHEEKKMSGGYCEPNCGPGVCK